VRIIQRERCLPQPGGNSSGDADSKFKIIQWVRGVETDTSLNTTERCVLVHLMLSAGRAGETTWTHRSLAAALGISERTSKRAVRRLDSMGRCRAIQRGLTRSNRYVLPWHPSYASTAPRGCRPRGASTQIAQMESASCGIRKIETRTPSYEVHKIATRTASPTMLEIETRTATRNGTTTTLGNLESDRRGPSAAMQEMALPEVPPAALPIRRKEALGKEVKTKTTSSAVEAPSIQGDDVAVVAFRETLAELAGAKLTRSDEHAVAELAAEQPELDRAAIRAGVAATLVRARGARVRSVRYYFPEIRRCLTDLPAAESRRAYAEHCVRKWQVEIGKGTLHASVRSKKSRF
jgi:hypothetical protein